MMFATSTLRNIAINSTVVGTIIDLLNGYGIWIPQNHTAITMGKVANLELISNPIAQVCEKYNDIAVLLQNESSIKPLKQFLHELKSGNNEDDNWVDWNKVTDLRVYLQMLQSDRYIAFFSVCGDGGRSVTARINEAMNELGLDGLKGKNGVSYYAVVFHGKAEKESADYGPIACEGELPRFCKERGQSDNEYFSYRIESGGVNGGNWSLIEVDAGEYWGQNEGINIVVYDSVVGRVVDCVHFNIDNEITCIRD